MLFVKYSAPAVDVLWLALKPVVHVTVLANAQTFVFNLSAEQ